MLFRSGRAEQSLTQSESDCRLPVSESGGTVQVPVELRVTGTEATRTRDSELRSRLAAAARAGRGAAAGLQCRGPGLGWA